MYDQRIAELEKQLSDERTLSDILGDALRCIMARIKCDPDMGIRNRFMSFDTSLRRDVDDQNEYVELALHEDINAAWDAYYRYDDTRVKDATGISPSAPAEQEVSGEWREFVPGRENPVQMGDQWAYWDFDTVTWEDWREDNKPNLSEAYSGMLYRRFHPATNQEDV
jgi:hypothetical protein